MSLAGSLAKTNTNVANNTSKVFNNGSGKPGKLGGMMDSVSGIQKNVAGTVVGAGNIVAKAAGAFGGAAGAKLAAALTGSTQIKYKPKNESSRMLGLAAFYDQFSKLSLNQIDRIDPFSTFECTFQFFPSIAAVQDVTKLFKHTVKETQNLQTMEVTEEEMGDSYSEVEGKTTYQTTIGKLFQQVMYKNMDLSEAQTSGEDIDGESSQSKEYKDGTSTEQMDENGNVYYNEVATKTITTQVHTKRPVTGDLVVNLGIYIQKVTLPNIQVEGAEEVTSMVGKFPVPGNIVIPDNTTFNMEVVNVEAPVVENIFYPWMRETTLPWWSYDDQPFTTATIMFNFEEHSNVRYWFFGCRPTQVQLIQPDQAPNQSLTRNVQFAFDFMTVETIGAKSINHKGKDAKKSSGKKNGNSKTGLANAALFSAANTLRL